MNNWILSFPNQNIITTGRHTFIPRKFSKPTFCPFEDFVNAKQVNIKIYPTFLENNHFFSHKFGIMELSSWIFVEIITVLIHSTLENYGKLKLEGAMKILMTKVIVVLQMGNWCPKRLSNPLEDTKKRTAMRSLEFSINKWTDWIHFQSLIWSWLHCPCSIFLMWYVNIGILCVFLWPFVF